MQLSPKLTKRLLPLYLATFFQGFVLWYCIEKLFMRSIGFNDAAIGLMVAIYSAAMLIFETPSGILADRWSRKGVLILASVAMAASSLVGGLSYGLPMFMVCACLWGLFFALYSGTNEAIIYDMLQEEGHSSDLFEKAYGRARIWDSAGLVAGALIGGVTASLYGPRINFFLSIPIALAGIVALTYLREPTLHKAKEAVGLVQHIRDTLRPVFTQRTLLRVLLVLVLLTLVSNIVYEFVQLWWLALAMPVVLYGPANALLLANFGLGGWLAQYFRSHRGPMITGLIVVMVLGAAGLVVSHNLAVIITCQFFMLAGVAVLEVVYTRQLHDGLEAAIRAGAASAVSTMGRIILIPVALLFGYLSDAHSIFRAALVPLMVVLAIAVLALMRRRA